MRANSFALLTNPRYVGRPLRANGGESAFTVSNLTTAVALMLLRGALYLRQEDLGKRKHSREWILVHLISAHPLSLQKQRGTSTTKGSRRKSLGRLGELACLKERSNVDHSSKTKSARDWAINTARQSHILQICKGKFNERDALDLQANTQGKGRDHKSDGIPDND